MKSKRFVTYEKKNLVLIKMIRMHLNYTLKSEIIVITQENLEELLIVLFVIENTKINSGSISTYDYHFIINKLAKEFYGQLEYLGEKKRNALLFQYQLVKDLITVKKIRAD